jgi:hypothetical protein
MRICKKQHKKLLKNKLSTNKQKPPIFWHIGRGGCFKPGIVRIISTLYSLPRIFVLTFQDHSPRTNVITRDPIVSADERQTTIDPYHNARANYLRPYKKKE